MSTAAQPHRSRPARGWRAALVALATLVTATLLAAPAVAACHIAAFSSGTVEAAESAGEVTLTVVLQGEQPSCEGTVEYATQDGSAVAGEDYEAASGTLSFSQGDDRRETITVTLLADDAEEGAEDLQVVLSNPTGSISGTGEPATVTITDAAADDETEAPTEEPGTTEPTAEPTTEPATEDQFPWVLVVVVILVLVGAGVAYAFRGGRRPS